MGCYYKLPFSTLISLSSLLNGHSQTCFFVGDPTQCYIQVTKTSILKTRKDFQWWRKISPEIRCANMRKYHMFIWAGRTSKFVTIFREAWCLDTDYESCPCKITISVQMYWMNRDCGHRPTVNTYAAHSSRPSTLLYAFLLLYIRPEQCWNLISQSDLLPLL